MNYPLSSSPEQLLVTISMYSTAHTCPVEYCLYTFVRTRDLKLHINMHLLCQCVRHARCLHSPLRRLIALFFTHSTAGTAALSAHYATYSRPTLSRTSHLVPHAYQTLPMLYARDSMHATHYSRYGHWAWVSRGSRRMGAGMLRWSSATTRSKCGRVSETHPR